MTLLGVSYPTIIREVGGWGAWSAADDVGGGIWSPAMVARAPTRRRMGNRADLHSRRV